MWRNKIGTEILDRVHSQAYQWRMPRPSPEDLDICALLERRLDISDEREPFRARVALKRVDDVPAETLERIALRCSSAFVSVPLCPSCSQPTHASESNDDGVCVVCLGDAAVSP